MKPSKIKPNLNYSFSVGDSVCIIDRAENPSEWAVFIIRDFFNSKYRLSPIDRADSYDKPLWVYTDEIIQVNA